MLWGFGDEYSPFHNNAGGDDQRPKDGFLAGLDRLHGGHILLIICRILSSSGQGFIAVPFLLSPASVEVAIVLAYKFNILVLVLFRAHCVCRVWQSLLMMKMQTTLLPNAKLYRHSLLMPVASCRSGEIDISNAHRERLVQRDWNHKTQ